MSGTRAILSHPHLFWCKFAKPVGGRYPTVHKEIAAGDKCAIGTHEKRGYVTDFVWRPRSFGGGRFNHAAIACAARRQFILRERWDNNSGADRVHTCAPLSPANGLGHHAQGVSTFGKKFFQHERGTVKIYPENNLGRRLQGETPAAWMTPEMEGPAEACPPCPARSKTTTLPLLPLAVSVAPCAIVVTIALATGVTQEVLARIAAAVTVAADEDRAAGHAARINGGARGQMNVPAGDDDGAADGLFGCGRDLARDSRGAAGRGEIDRTAVAALRRGSVELTRNIDRAALGQQLDGALVRDGRSGTARQRRHGTGLDKCLNC
jgi:hypothetical protein